MSASFKAIWWGHRSCPNEFWLILPFHDKGRPLVAISSIFLCVGPPSPTSKVQHRVKFLAFNTCPNCIGRSLNSCAERPERQLHSWTAMFTTKHFRPPSLHETISHLCLQKTRHARFLHLRLCQYNQLKCQFLSSSPKFCVVFDSYMLLSFKFHFDNFLKSTIVYRGEW